MCHVNSFFHSSFMLVNSVDKTYQWFETMSMNEMYANNQTISMFGNPPTFLQKNKKNLSVLKKTAPLSLKVSLSKIKINAWFSFIYLRKMGYSLSLPRTPCRCWFIYLLLDLAVFIVNNHFFNRNQYDRYNLIHLELLLCLT